MKKGLSVRARWRKHVMLKPSKHRVMLLALKPWHRFTIKEASSECSVVPVVSHSDFTISAAIITPGFTYEIEGLSYKRLIRFKPYNFNHQPKEDHDEPVPQCGESPGRREEVHGAVASDPGPDR